jgi:hypothetical protein
MIKRTQKELEFIQFVKAECKKYGVNCSLRNVNYVKLSGNIKCGGWFDETGPELVASLKRPDWIEILAHEYSHLTQWVENTKEWQAAMIAMPKVDDWLGGKNIRNIEKYLNDSRDLELDNEKRAVKLIKKWALDVDLDRYIRKANAYVQFYNWMKETRKWATPKNSPYRNEIIIAAMPNKFNMNYEIMGEKYKKIFKEQNI